jgi:hypothetical protein
VGKNFLIYVSSSSQLVKSTSWLLKSSQRLEGIQEIEMCEFVVVEEERNGSRERLKLLTLETCGCLNFVFWPR